MTEPIEELRSILSKVPGPTRWHRLCSIVDGLDLLGDAPDQWLLDYALQHVESWPDALRVAPSSWVQAQARAEPVPGWPLARTIRMEGANSQDIKSMLKIEALSSVERLELIDCKLGPTAGVKALSEAKTVSNIKELSIQRGLLTDKGWELLMGSSFVSQLHTLELVPAGYPILPNRQQLTTRALELLAASTHLSNLRSLTFHGGDFMRYGRIPEALARAPHMQKLEYIAFHEWGEEPLLAFFRNQHLPELTSIDLCNCSFRTELIEVLTSAAFTPNIKSLRLSMRGSFDTIMAELRSEDLVPLFRCAGLTSLTDFSIDTNDHWDPTPLLRAPWAPQLHSLRIIGRLNDNGYCQLAQDPALSELSSLALLRPLGEQLYLSHRPSMSMYDLCTFSTADAWLTTTQRPALQTFETSLHFELSEESKQTLSQTCRALAEAPPYPAWEQWVEQLVMVGGLEAQLLHQRGAEQLQEHELNTIEFDFEETTTKSIKELLKGPTLEHCGVLVLGVDPSNISEKQLVALLSSDKLQHLRSLSLNSFGWLAKGTKLNNALHAIASNPALKRLQEFDHSIRAYDMDSIAGFLACKTSPYLSRDIRDALSIKATYGSNFNYSFGIESMKAMCACEALLGLDELDLSQVHISDASAKTLAGCAYLAHLKRLDLSRNHIGDVGARALANSPHLSQLEELNLGYNSDITAKGYKAIVASEYLSASIKKKYKRKAH